MYNLLKTDVSQLILSLKTLSFTSWMNVSVHLYGVTTAKQALVCVWMFKCCEQGAVLCRVPSDNLVLSRFEVWIRSICIGNW